MVCRRYELPVPADESPEPLRFPRPLDPESSWEFILALGSGLEKLLTLVTRGGAHLQSWHCTVWGELDYTARAPVHQYEVGAQAPGITDHAHTHAHANEASPWPPLYSPPPPPSSPSILTTLLRGDGLSSPVRAARTTEHSNSCHRSTPVTPPSAWRLQCTPVETRLKEVRSSLAFLNPVCAFLP